MATTPNHMNCYMYWLGFLMQNDYLTDKINVENLSFFRFNKNQNMNLICLRDLKLSLYELLDIWPDSEHLKKFNVQK